jgi:hypothetical protein
MKKLQIHCEDNNDDSLLQFNNRENQQECGGNACSYTKCDAGASGQLEKHLLSHERKQPFVCVACSQACSEDITISIQGKSCTSVRRVARIPQDLVVSRNITRFTQGRNYLWVMTVARCSLSLVTSQSIIAPTRRKCHTFVEFVTNGSHGLTVKR